MKPFILATCAGLAIAGAAIAQAGATGPAQTIKMRQGNYKQMASAMKGINDQLRADTPSIPAIRRHSALLVRHSLRVLRWFPHGSGPEARVPTRAKAEIWSDPAGFRRAGARLLVATRQLDAAARRHDVAAVRAAVRPVQASCGGCHDAYRGPPL